MTTTEEISRGIVAEWILRYGGSFDYAEHGWMLHLFLDCFLDTIKAGHKP